MNYTRLMLLFSLVLLGGCTQEVRIKALSPAEISRAAQTKRLAVTPFKNDRVGLADKVEAKLASQRIDGHPYFTLTSRLDFDKVIKEQRYQNTGLLDPDDAVEVGHIVGAQAIISGRVGTPSLQDTYYYEIRTRCNKEGCWEVKVGCKKRTAGLSAQVRMVDVTHGDIIYADTLEEHAQWHHCDDDASGLPSRQMAADYLAERIAQRFAYKLTPHYVSFEVALLEDPDIDYTDKQKQLLKFALSYIEQQRLDKAERLLQRLLESTGERSYVPFYDLGVIYEARGNYREAQTYYEAADRLTVKPVEAINSAIVRIRDLIAKSEKAQAQISAGQAQ